MTFTPAAPPQARFIPGQLLAGRYRVVERIGQGGAGEVYRAEDLKLGEPVALKFIADPMAEDSGALQQLFDEVKLARHVSHPNVCRVHDIVEIEGAHALSMEFVDGEDLASLLLRVGRLPQDRAVLIAHELCAGLAAIHARGLLHRDMKPGNVMIDGRGHARIADFGLAVLRGGAAGGDTIAGTPGYMAPETLAVGEQDVESDVYSLGLVMYELFCGHTAFEPLPWAERLRAERPPVPPSRYSPELDAAIDRVVMQCLEREPRRRPRSARDVAAALPGGDPLAAAIARGDTPSPAAVAAVRREHEGLSRRAAWACGAALLLGLGALLAVAPHTRLVARMAPTDSPDALAWRARTLLHARGLVPPAVDRASGYAFDEAAIERIATSDRSSSRWDRLSGVRPPVVTFWYRESPRELAPSPPLYRVRYDDPPWVAGMSGVQLDPGGALVRADAPASTPVPLATPTADGTATPAGDPSARVTRTVLGAVRPALLLLSFGFAAWLARRNLRAGRGDPRRAVRVAAAMFAIRAVVWLLGGHHTAHSAMEQTTTALAWGLYDFVYGWIVYMAVEPYVRRLWPRMLPGWARLLDGQRRDARVGRELVVGCVGGTMIALLVAGHQAAPVLFGAPPGRPDNVGYIEDSLASLLGLRQQFAGITWLVRSALVQLMAFMVILVAARLVVRRPTLAWTIAVMAFVPLALPRGEFVALNLALALASLFVLAWLALRVGLLAAAVALATHALLESAPLAPLGDTPQSRASLVVLAIVMGLGIYGLTNALERRRPAGVPLAAS